MNRFLKRIESAQFVVPKLLQRFVRAEVGAPRPSSLPPPPEIADFQPGGLSPEALENARDFIDAVRQFPAWQAETNARLAALEKQRSAEQAVLSSRIGVALFSFVSFGGRFLLSGFCELAVAGCTCGFEYLYRLVMEAGTPIPMHVLLRGVQADPDPRSLQPVFDERAKAAMKAQLQDLESDLDEAVNNNDLARIEKVRADRDELRFSLSAAFGLAGRPPDLNDGIGRSRARIWGALRTAFKYLR